MTPFVMIAVVVALAGGLAFYFHLETKDSESIAHPKKDKKKMTESALFYVRLFANKIPKEQKELLKRVKVMCKQDSKNIIIVLSRIFCKILSLFGLDLEYDRRTTTQGKTIYLGTGYYHSSNFSQFKTLMHELEHVRQWQKWWILYPLTYILNIWHLIPLVLVFSGLWWGFVALLVIICGFIPAGLSMRGYWEMTAFAVSLRSYKWYGFTSLVYSDILLDVYVDYITGGSYLYALAFILKKIRTYYQNLIKELSE